MLQRFLTFARTALGIALVVRGGQFDATYVLAGTGSGGAVLARQRPGWLAAGRNQSRTGGNAGCSSGRSDPPEIATCRTACAGEGRERGGQREVDFGEAAGGATGRSRLARGEQCEAGRGMACSMERKLFTLPEGKGRGTRSRRIGAGVGFTRRMDG